MSGTRYSTKEELGGGFPQLKPAFIIKFDWDAAHMIGPNLGHVKFHGRIESVHDSSLPHFAAHFVDAGGWVQQEDHSGENWTKWGALALLRVVEAPSTSADPAVAKTETGFIRMKWYAVGNPEIAKLALAKDVPGLIEEISKEDEPGRLGAMTFLFETGDPRYKYLEHAVYVGKSRLVVVPSEHTEGGLKVICEVPVSYFAA